MYSVFNTWNFDEHEFSRLGILFILGENYCDIENRQLKM